MPGKLISIVLSLLPLLIRCKAAEVVVISDDDDDDDDGHDNDGSDGSDGSDQEIHLIANPVLTYSQQSTSRPALPLPHAPGNRNGNSSAIVIDSDSDSEDGIAGIETDDDDDDGEDQDILGLLSQMADDSMTTKATATAKTTITAKTRTRTTARTIGSTQSTSVLETCHSARMEIAQRGSTRRRPLGKSRTFAESILAQASLL